MIAGDRGRSALTALGGWALFLGAACARGEGGDLTAALPEEPAPARPSARFVCSEGCKSFKTVFPGEEPPPCCGAPMDPAPSAESASAPAGE
jgi:hypothetical protein